MNRPKPTLIFRLIHLDNLNVCLRRNGLYAPKHEPDDGLPYKPIHNTDIQSERNVTHIPLGPKGTIHDYVPFYLGPRPPMLLQLHTGRVLGYGEGQEPLIYLISSVKQVEKSQAKFVFSDGHGIALYTEWFDNPSSLDDLDWEAIYSRSWRSTVNDMDRQRRKQAEFLVHKFFPWDIIKLIIVLNSKIESKIESILSQFDDSMNKKIKADKTLYY